MSNPNNVRTAGQQWASLDGLRGVAIGMVVFYHCFYFNPSPGLGAFLDGLRCAGSLGVLVFFVLSGFLIGLSVFRMQGASDIRSYAIRRGVRIYPPFFFALLFTAPFALLWKGEPVSEYVGSSLRYLLTLEHFDRTPVYQNPVYWSLQCEIHFYLALPIVFLFLRRSSLAMADIWTTALFLVVPLVIRAGWPPSPLLMGIERFDASIRFPRTFDAFGYGMGFACIYLRFRESPILLKWAGRCCAAGVGLFLLVCTTSACFERIWDLSGRGHNLAIAEAIRQCTCVATFLMLFLTLAPSSSRARRLFAWGPLVGLGSISYEWFLLHMPIAQFIGERVGLAEGDPFKYALRTVGPALLSLVLAWVVWLQLSLPLMAYGRSFASRKSALANPGANT